MLASARWAKRVQELLLAIEASLWRTPYRILRTIQDNPGISEDRLFNTLLNKSITGRWLPPDSTWTWLFGYPHTINFDNDMAILEEWGLITWEGEDPDWRYYPVQYPKAPPEPP
jgi:hypothetical protein